MGHRDGPPLLRSDVASQLGSLEETVLTLAEAPLRRISERDINDEAMRGLKENTRRAQAKLGRSMPSFLAGIVGRGFSVMDWDLRRAGGISYRLYCFTKD